MTAEIRELLELAAKSIGYSVESWGEDFAWCYIPGSKLNGDGEEPIFKWNPLESGDDLIDLMVKLSMAITWVDSFDEVICWILHGVGNENVTATEKISDHPTRKAALAMAILRCAAEYQRRKG